MAKKRLKEYKGLTNRTYKIPTSVTDTIPINRIAENGVFELEAGEGVKLYDKAYLFYDINYQTKDESERESLNEDFRALLNSLNVSFKMIISNTPKNLEELNNSIFRSAANDNYSALASEYQKLISQKNKDPECSMEQARYFIISCLKYDYEGANAFFDTMENQLSLSFKALGSGLLPLNASQRLRSLHNFYRMGREKEYEVAWDDCIHQRRDWRRDIINTSIKEHDDHLTFDYGHRFVAVLFVKKYPSGLKDSFVNDIASLPFPLIITMDCEPTDTDYAYKILTDKYMATERSINRQQEMKNKQGNFSTDVSYDKRKELEELEEALDGIRSFDEKLFYVDVLIAVSAPTKEELDKNVEMVINCADGDFVGVDVHVYQQLDALNTTLPTAARFVNTMRPLFTTSLSGLVPFNVQEINDRDGFFYGLNLVSRNNIIANRKLLKNGNGHIFGKSGSGKSQDAKFEIGQVVAFTADDVIIIDPMGEYKDIVGQWNGDYITFTRNEQKKTYINPLHVPDRVDDIPTFISEKAEFLYALCEQAIKPDVLTNRHINVIDRACREMYEDYFNQNTENAESPTIITLREKLMEYGRQGDKNAGDMADQLEAFAVGTLNVFAHQETSQEDNRIKAYDLSQLGRKMKKLAMLVTIESVTSRLKYNAKDKKATWVYVDEEHELWEDAYSVSALNNMWREVRKLGGLCTGITQHVTDGLQNDDTKSMLANSEFTMFLDQGSISRDALIDVFDISEAQMKYINNSPPGTGLVRFGEKIIPFDNTMPKESALYDMYNTSFHDGAGDADE